MTVALLDSVAEACAGYRVADPEGPEAAIRDGLSAHLQAAGFLVGVEQPAGQRQRVDLEVLARDGTSRVGIEIKRRRPHPGALAAQLRRYVASGRFAGFVVLAERAVTVEGVGVPVCVLGFGRAWGIAV